jgi:hypothetical protein
MNPRHRPGLRVAAGTLLVTSLLLSGCSTMEVTANGCPLNSQQAASDTFFFGTISPQGGVVNEEQWLDFLTTVVTPRSPRGLTWWRTHGQWLDSAGKLWEEDCFVLHLVHERGQEKLMLEIRDAYVARFHQEAVLRERGTVCVSW